MADRERRKQKPRDYKALNVFSTADIYHVFKKKGYRPKSKIFQVERLLSRRKSGNLPFPTTDYFPLGVRVPCQVGRVAHVIVYVGAIHSFI